MKKLFHLYAAPSKRWARILGDTLLAASAILAGATFANPLWEQKRIAIYVGPAEKLTLHIHSQFFDYNIFAFVKSHI